MRESVFDTKVLPNIAQVEVIYKGLDNNLHQANTEIKNISKENFIVNFAYEGEFTIEHPQSVDIRFVIDNALYISKTTLSYVKRVGKEIYFTIMMPKMMSLVQKRKYYRIKLERSCVLIATDENGNSTSFLSRVVDISAGGILMHKLESMYDDKYVNIEPEKYKKFNIVLFLDVDVVLKLSARYVRFEKANRLKKYAFEFTKMNLNDINTISKYVAKEQLIQLKANQNNKPLIQ